MKFRCPSCRRKLTCGVKCVGRSMVCPNCKVELDVPSPSHETVRDAIPAIEFPMPGGSLVDYEKAYSLIMRQVKFTDKLCEYCNCPTLSRAVIVDAISALGNLNAFVTHALEAETGRDMQLSSPLTEGLANFAIDSDYGGIGVSKAKRRQYERWEDGLEPAKFVTPDSDFLGLIQDSIERLKMR